MIILHSLFHRGKFYIWGEVSPDLLKSGEESHSDRLLFGASSKILRKKLKEAGMEWEEEQEVSLWLPTYRKKAVPSSPMIGSVSCKSPPILHPWKTSALILNSQQTVEFLTLADDKEILTPGTVVGKDTAFFARLVQWAGSLTVRQKFLPGISREGEIYKARWIPLIEGEDREYLSKIADLMPHCCRTAETEDPPHIEEEEKDGDKQESPLFAHPQTIITLFIEKISDYLIRCREGVTPKRGRKKDPQKWDSLHEQWICRLSSPEGDMEGEKEELEKLSQQIREWSRPLYISSRAPFKLCFRLEEPEISDDGEEPIMGEESVWTIRYLIQSLKDPSLIVPLDKVWNMKKSKKKIMDWEGFNVREYLLTSLGRASMICPHIEESLKTPSPLGYQTDGGGAVEFLTEKAWQLEQAGFGIFFPSWWARKGSRTRLNARAMVKTPDMKVSSGQLSLNTLVLFNWQLALGDNILSFNELEQLAKIKTSLVKIRGQWVLLNAQEIQSALEFWKKKGEGKMAVRDLIKTALGGTTEIPGVEFQGICAEGWIKKLLEELQGTSSPEELPPPMGFRGNLRPYQIRGYSWMDFMRRWGFGICLADDMGLGKTIQVLALIQKDWEAEKRKPVLIVCPTSVMGNWQKEAERFTPRLPVMVHHGIKREKGEEFLDKAKEQALVISGYSLLHRDFDFFSKVQWGGIILDEAQNIKNPETKQSRSARSLQGDYKITLTGTPVENNVGDLWSILEFLNPGFLGSQKDFKTRYFIPIQVNKQRDAIEELKKITSPFILRRLKTDKNIIQDLPEKMEMKVYSTLTREQVSLYQAVLNEVAESLDSLSGITRKGVILSTILKLKQICNHPAHFLGDNSPIPHRSGKLARLTEMLEEILLHKERTLIFTQFREMGGILQKYLQEIFGREIFFLHGGVKKKDRDDMIERFQNDPSAPYIFILSLKAGGTGLNLTSANHVFHFDRWWNPAVENQATDRAFRIGQTRNVQVHKFVCLGTMEERIDDMIEQKKDIAQNVVGTGEGWITELSTEEIRDILSLRQSAFGEGV